MILAMLKKDLILYFRNPLYALVTVLGLVAYTAIYWALPATVNDDVPIAVHSEGVVANLLTSIFAEGLNLQTFDDAQAMQTAVERGDAPIGLTLTSDEVGRVLRGDTVDLEIFVAPNLPIELQAGYGDLLGATLNARSLNVERVVETLGGSTLERPLAMRDLLVPTLVLFLSLVGAMGLATLIVEETELGTAQAVLITRLNVPVFMLAKALMGTLLAFVEIILLMLFTWKIAVAPVELLFVLLGGGVLASGLGFLIASFARDNTGVLGYSMIFLIVFSIPSITLIFPSLGSEWMRYVPSFHLITALHSIINLGMQGTAVLGNVLVVFGFGLVMMVLGSGFISRRIYA